MKKLLPNPALLLLVIAVACATGRAVRDVEPPLQPAGSAYEAAALRELPKTSPEEHTGLHNLYQLSEDIVSGSEPEGEEALRQLSEMGIKTILSVDGKEPDHETAARYGMRYVHVPIRYRGIEEDELLAIAKTFRELEGPFYVHCFHGKHRGPAAAAVGRVILDGAPREQAIAEMRQWCGTSSKYEGLYSTIAYGDLPSEAETDSFSFDFAPAHRFAGFRHAMVDLPRSFDTIAALKDRDWTPDPTHPDASARNEAAKMLDIFVQAQTMEDVQGKPEDFRRWLEESESDSRTLVDLLARYERGDADAGEEAKDVVSRIKATCTACHSAYRNHR